MNIGTRVRIPEAARLSFFWFGIQVVWGAVLGVLLQVRLVSIFADGAAARYALFAAVGAAAAILAQLEQSPQKPASDCPLEAALRG